MRTDIRELLTTAAVTVAIVLVVFVALRVVFPDPPLAGTDCSFSRGQQVSYECIWSLHTSLGERNAHRLATGLVVVFLASAMLLLVERRAWVAHVRVSLAMAMAAGFAALPAVFELASGGRSRFAYLAAVGLFALAAGLRGQRLAWWQYVVAAVIGAVLLYGSLLFFFEEG
ncbi:MAG: hypothetical protein O2895_05720 [Chloroflexi bacterium]|nr:hypothetical protein [Chloroflexota bacterium]